MYATVPFDSSWRIVSNSGYQAKLFIGYPTLATQLTEHGSELRKCMHGNAPSQHSNSEEPMMVHAEEQCKHLISGRQTSNAEHVRQLLRSSVCALLHESSPVTDTHTEAHLSSTEQEPRRSKQILVDEPIIGQAVMIYSDNNRDLWVTLQVGLCKSQRQLKL